MPTNNFPFIDSAGASRVMAAIDQGSGELAKQVVPMLYDGTTYDRLRNNEERVLLASTSRAAAYTDSALQTNYNCRGVTIRLDATAKTTGNLTLYLYSVLNGLAYILHATSPAITDVGNIIMVMYPGISTTAAGGY